MVDQPRLAPCPDKPNCVSTEAADGARRMEPIPFEGAAELAMQRLVAVVEDMGAKVKRREGSYLHAEFTTSFFRFVDDVDFVIDGEAGEIHFRSASRLGHWDMGKNRRRMEEVRRRFQGES